MKVSYRVSLLKKERDRSRGEAHLDTASLAVNAVLTVDDQPLANCVFDTSFRVYVLVYSSGTDSSEETCVLFDVRLDVSGTVGFVDMEVDGLVLGVVRTRARDLSQEVEREDTVRSRVIDRFVLTRAGEIGLSSVSFEEKPLRASMNSSLPRRFSSSVILVFVVESPRNPSLQDQRVQSRIRHSKNVSHLRPERRPQVTNFLQFGSDPRIFEKFLVL